jgi:hypothetical protein
MSQAEKSNTPIPSRRAFLTRSAPAAAAFALAGGAAVNVVATGLAATPEPAATTAVDPIFALIKRHRKALAKQARLGRISTKLWEIPGEDDLNRGGVVVGEKKIRRDELVERNEDVLHMRFVPTDEVEPIVVLNEKHLPQYAPTNLTEDERAGWVKEKTKELRRNRRADNHRRRNSPYGRAYDAWNEACEIAEELTGRLVETRPTTVAGLAAVLAYWSEIATEDEHFLDLYATASFLEKMGQAAQAIA